MYIENNLEKRAILQILKVKRIVPTSSISAYHKSMLDDIIFKDKTMNAKVDIGLYKLTEQDKALLKQLQFPILRSLYFKVNSDTPIQKADLNQSFVRKLSETENSVFLSYGWGSNQVQESFLAYIFYQTPVKKTN